MDELTLTGERTLPGLEVENYWYRRHEAAYRAVLGWLPAGRVLEAGAGEGYGAALLTAAGRPVVALDYDPAAIRHLGRTYPAVRPVRGNVVTLPFRDGAFDAVVSMQVVEHLWDQPGYVAECARVLRPGGLLVVSTPNRLTFSPGYDPAAGRPRNLYHTREFSAAELVALVGRRAEVTGVHGLHAGPRLAALDRDFGGPGGSGGLVEAQLRAPVGEWPVALRRAVAGVRAADFAVRSTGVDACLDLIVVASVNHVVASLD
jgi:SAM-dependent methyltransferase